MAIEWNEQLEAWAAMLYWSDLDHKSLFEEHADEATRETYRERVRELIRLRNIKAPPEE